MKITQLIIAAIFLSLLFSCEKEVPDIKEDSGFTHGAFITNEGAFGSSNGSLSYLDLDSMLMYNNLFYSVNNRPLGDVVQSFTVHNSRGYIVVNNSQKVEVVDMETFTSLGVIQGLSYPRYFLGISDSKGYVSNGELQGQVYVVDLNTLAVIDSISVGFGPEQMLMKNSKVYVANSGGWGIDSTLSVIDPNQDVLLNTIQVGHVPVSLTLDVDENLWVLCKGKVIWGADWSISEETDSELLMVNPGNNQIESRVKIGITGDYFWPARMATDITRGNILFTEKEGIFKMDILADSQPVQPLISKDFYGFGVDPKSGGIFALTSPTFTEDGFLHRYSPGGDFIDSVKVGVGPSGVVFN